MFFTFKRIFASLLALLMMLTGWMARPAPQMTDLYVSPTGSDGNAGTKTYTKTVYRLVFLSVISSAVFVFPDAATHKNKQCAQNDNIGIFRFPSSPSAPAT